MKKIIAGIMLLSAMLPMACFASQDASEQRCNQIYQIAYLVQQGHQNNYPINQAIDDANHSFSGDFLKGVKQIIVDAYKEPAHYEDQYKKKSEVDFANKYAGACYGAVEID